MTITPPPPTDLSGLVEAFAQTTGAVLDLAGGLDESQAGLATECPGWTVLDQVRHVASIEALILGEPVPDHDVSSHAHVRNDFGVIIEKYLEGRRARSLQDVVDELTEVRERRLADLGAPDQTLESPSASPFGPATHGDVLPMRVFDIWCHEQDLREALGVPGGLDTAAAALSVSRGLMGLPRKIAQAGLLADGRRVVIEVTGPVATTFTVSVATNEAGKAIGKASAGADDGTAARVALDTRAFMRRIAGRWPVDQLAAEISGDASLAAQVLEAMVVTP